MAKIKTENTKLAVIGLGYVGLPLAHAFSFRYPVVGFDIAQWRINELQQGHDRTLELSDEQVKEAIDNGMLFTNELDDIKECNVYIVTVPTPIDEHKTPDLTPLKKASESIGKVLKAGDIVIYESTVYPGATEEVCIPILEKVSGLKYISTENNSTLNTQNYDAIVLAVAHNEFKAMDLNASEDTVVFDIKGILNKDAVDGRL